MEENMEIRKLMELCDRLPDVNQTYIMNLNKSTATKIIYAYELLRFQDYAAKKFEFQENTAGYAIYSKISYDDIKEYFRINIEKGNGYSTIQRTRTALNGWFDHLNDIKAIRGNPVCSGKVLEQLFWEKTGKNPKESEKKKADPEVTGFLDAVENGTGLSGTQKKYHEKYRLRDMAMITLMLDTGIKISEVNALNIEDFDRNFSQIYVQKRAIKMKKETRERVEQYIDQSRVVSTDSDRLSPLFVTSDGKRLAVRSIQRILKKYSAAGSSAQVISAEKLREISASKFYQETKDMQELKERMGVKSMTAIEKYIGPQYP
ncbi:MAG: tyrosine-type recombinase/integrase [Lachnospiraceae bacterium]|nr:tyrosine-type recombinase/integrase [Lachnospiraceae bacterium]